MLEARLLLIQGGVQGREWRDPASVLLLGSSARSAGIPDHADLSPKVYQPQGNEGRYSPAEVASTEVVPVFGDPDPARICTSIVERQNLNIRMGNRRFTRLTNAFSKKIENRVHALSIYFMHYNFFSIHQTTRVTPAMAAGVSKILMSVADMIQIMDEWEASSKDAE